MKPSRLIILPAVLGLLALTACGPVDSSTETRPSKVYQGEMRTFSNQAQAVAFAKSRVAECDTAITFRLPGANSATAQSIANAVSSDPSIMTITAMAFGGIVILEPVYSEDTLLLRAYHDPAIEASLTPSQKKALANARRAVAEARRRGSDYEQALYLHDYLVTHTTYASSGPAKSLNSCTTAVLAGGEGVCEGYTRAYRLLLNMAGIQNVYVGGRAKEDTHCWNLVKLGGQWVHIDCTFDDPRPDMPDRALHGYFGMSDSQIAATHTWNHGAVPSASTTALYHPFRQGWHFATMQEFVDYASTHQMPHGYITVYIEELGTPGANARGLLEAAQNRSGRRVVAESYITPTNPRAFNCICNY